MLSGLYANKIYTVRCVHFSKRIVSKLDSTEIGTIPVAKIVVRRQKSTIQFFIKLKTIFYSLKYMCLCLIVIKFTTYKHKYLFNVPEF